MDWNFEDVSAVLFLIVLIVFLVFCFVLGGRRWRYVRAVNTERLQHGERTLKLSEEAVADQKKILVTLEEIKALLQDRKV